MQLTVNPNCVSEKMGVNNKGVNQKCIPIRKNGVYRGHRNKKQSANGIKPNIRGVNWEVVYIGKGR
jgi:hypothetical protein